MTFCSVLITSLPSLYAPGVLIQFLSFYPSRDIVFRKLRIIIVFYMQFYGENKLLSRYIFLKYNKITYI